MGVKLHSNDEFVRGVNFGAMAILERLKEDIENIYKEYENNPIRHMITKCDGEGDSSEYINEAIKEIYGYGKDPLSSKEKEKIRKEIKDV